MEKINIAELLKDCPQGMELDCTMFEKPVKYMGLSKNEPYIIAIKTSCDKFFYLTKEGYLYDTPDSKCVIFPKGRTTWEGFVPPCEFKDGDILTNDRGSICIYKGPMYYNNNLADFYCGYRITDRALVLKGKDEHFGDIDVYRLATEEEKARLFQAIKDNGYKWNAETKTLAKLIEPKFKVGDRIKYKNGKNIDGVEQGIILSITDETFDVIVSSGMGIVVAIVDQDNWELVPDKFDITTLKPFDKVLARDTDNSMWIATLFSHLRGMTFYTVSSWYNQCIPFEGNEHLIGTTYDCDTFYKTWK